MKNETFDLKVEKKIPKPVHEVFKALSEGRLFQNCGADQESLTIDFKIGGKYFIQFLNYEMKNEGEFLEIIQNEKIVFTWCQDYDTNPSPDTTVTILLKDLGDKTALTLTHTGFSDLDHKNGHEGGWSGGLNDLTEELINLKLHFTRKAPMKIDKLYETCKHLDTFLAHFNPSEDRKLNGKIKDFEENRKITFDLKSNFIKESSIIDSKITLLFEAEDEKSAWIEVFIEGFKNEAELKNQRKAWDFMLNKNFI